MSDKPVPVYKLIKPFPGCRVPVGSIFCYSKEGTPDGLIRTEFGLYFSEWKKESYFEPFVGEFFEKL